MKLLSGKKVFTYIGISLIAIGFITFLSAVGHMRVAGGFPWLFFTYALMDTLLGAGFIVRERWILPMLGLNLGGYMVLNAVTLLLVSSPDLIHIGVNILSAGSLYGVVYIARGQLAETRFGRLQAAAFVLLWALAYVGAWTSLSIT